VVSTPVLIWEHPFGRGKTDKFFFSAEMAR